MGVWPSNKITKCTSKSNLKQNTDYKPGEGLKYLLWKKIHPLYCKKDKKNQVWEDGNTSRYLGELIIREQQFLLYIVFAKDSQQM